MIENSFNPFKKDPDPDRLFNICTYKSIGNEVRKCFIQEYVENLNRFGERIKKKSSFATETGKRKIRGAEGKIIEALRDLFGSMLCLSMQQKIDMAEVLKCPPKFRCDEINFYKIAKITDL